MFIIILLLLLIALYLNNSQYLEKYENVKNKIIMKIFVADWCPACQNYKKNEHEQIKNKLLNIYDNIEFEFIENKPENDELFEENEIKYLPTIIIEKNGSKKKLNKMINFNNINDLIE